MWRVYAIKQGEKITLKEFTLIHEYAEWVTSRPVSNYETNFYWLMGYYGALTVEWVAE